jgi:hypothetical protein
MSRHQSSQVRSQSWLDFITLALMSLTAPWIAAYIHSALVVGGYSGHTFRDAEIWSVSPDLWSILSWIGACGAPGAITFLVLLPFRKRALFRWLVWLGFIALWTFMFIAHESPRK